MGWSGWFWVCLSVYVSSLGGDRVGCVLWVCFGGPFHGMLLRCVSGYVSGICFAEVEPTITDPYWLWHRITVRSTSNEEDIACAAISLGNPSAASLSTLDFLANPRMKSCGKAYGSHGSSKIQPFRERFFGPKLLMKWSELFESKSEIIHIHSLLIGSQVSSWKIPVSKHETAQSLLKVLCLSHRSLPFPPFRRSCALCFSLGTAAFSSSVSRITSPPGIPPAPGMPGIPGAAPPPEKNEPTNSTNLAKPGDCQYGESVGTNKNCTWTYWECFTFWRSFKVQNQCEELRDAYLDLVQIGPSGRLAAFQTQWC